MEDTTHFKIEFNEFITDLKYWRCFFENDVEYKNWINRQCSLYKPSLDELNLIRSEIKFEMEQYNNTDDNLCQERNRR